MLFSLLPYIRYVSQYYDEKDQTTKFIWNFFLTAVVGSKKPPLAGWLQKAGTCVEVINLCYQHNNQNSQPCQQANPGPFYTAALFTIVDQVSDQYSYQAKQESQGKPANIKICCTIRIESLFKF